MKNAMQLKAIMKNLSKEKHISAQLLLQNYMMERLLERISQSKYKEFFIIKGGFLIAAMVGLDTRATMDIDATIKGYPVTEKTIKTMFEEICDIYIPDDIVFEFKHIGEIREGDEYTGYRVSVTANYAPMAVPLKLDITTGDVITPKEISFAYPMMLEDRTISVLAYNLETILAEKLETVISRSDQNTRPRDYYDIFILYRLWKNNVNMHNLQCALKATGEKRGSVNLLTEYKRIMEVVVNSEVMSKQWKKYQKDFAYASEVSFKDACNTVTRIMDIIGQWK
ncbi:nucleotidyl transferase AbiEii/AbiGii toxin family protein [Anaerovibrio slackiae]|uniref:nucleotidyl transferase AbiEii/AbiGii toxin family protein n=1 Tax=Anaerovibrio slackiae TaxID=2652309 RepID=UPI003F17348C